MYYPVICCGLGYFKINVLLIQIMFYYILTPATTPILIFITKKNLNLDFHRGNTDQPINHTHDVHLPRAVKWQVGI